MTLTIRYGDLDRLAACQSGLNAFASLVGRRKLEISSKEEAVSFAVAFLDSENPSQRLDWLDWLVEDILPEKAVKKASKKTYKILYGDALFTTVEPSKKACRRVAKYYGKKLWKHRKHIAKVFEKNKND